MDERITRPSVGALDEILGERLPVLDDGFIRVVDYMGTHESIVQAARVSYGKGTKHVRHDRTLLRYLMRHRHSTPFEMCEIKLHVRVPMDCWRQWIRHRTANVNEYSTRYSVAIDAAQATDPEQWRMQATANRQGSEGQLDGDAGQALSQKEQQFHEFARTVYTERLEAGVAREQARKDLPLSTYTEAYWKIDLRNLLHFLSLRMDPRSQYELRCYANRIGNDVVARWCPMAWEAFEDYQLDTLALSRVETQIVHAINSGHTERAVQIADDAGLLRRDDGKLKRSRERDELEAKLQGLGMQPPW